MKPTFAMNFAHDGIGLLHRAGRSWRLVGEAGLDDPRLGETLAYLRSTALGLEKGGITTKLILPGSQILYRALPAPGPDAKSRRRQIREGLEGLTPYPVRDLVFDWSGSGDSVQVAVVARETLDEAEAFAEEHRFNPLCFVAIPEAGLFDGEPWFGTSRRAAERLSDGETVERDITPVRLPDALKAREVQIPADPPATTESPDAAALAAGAGAIAAEDPAGGHRVPETVAGDGPDATPPRPDPRAVVPQDADSETPLTTAGETFDFAAGETPEIPAIHGAVTVDDLAEPAAMAEGDDAAIPETAVNRQASETGGDRVRETGLSELAEPPASAPQDRLDTGGDRSDPPGNPAPEETARPEAAHPDAAPVDPAPAPAFASRRAARRARSGATEEAAAEPPAAASLSWPETAGQSDAPETEPSPAAAETTTEPDVAGVTAPDAPFAEAETPQPDDGNRDGDASGDAAVTPAQTPAAKDTRGKRAGRLGPARRDAHGAGAKSAGPRAGATASATAAQLRNAAAAETRKPSGSGPSGSAAGLARATPAVAVGGAVPGARSITAKVTAKPRQAARTAGIPASEAEAMTVFGARAREGTRAKPRHLGLILLAILILFIAAVALWSSVFYSDGVASLFNRGEEPVRDEVAEAAPADLRDADPVPETPASPAGAAPTDDPGAGPAEPDDAAATPQVADMPMVPTIVSDLPQPGPGAADSDDPVLALLAPDDFVPPSPFDDAAPPGSDIPARAPPVADRADPMPEIDFAASPPPAARQDPSAANAGDAEAARAGGVAADATGLADGSDITPLSDADLAARYPDTGIWPFAPEVPRPPRSQPANDIYIASIDPNILSQDALALPPLAAATADRPPASPGTPPPFGTTFVVDERGLVLPTPEGSVTPDGVVVIAGPPPVIPPARGPALAPEPEVTEDPSADPALSGFRPRPRPGNLTESNQRLRFGGRSQTEIAALRPRPRPEGLAPAAPPPEAAGNRPSAVDEAVASALALPVSPRPGARPRTFERVAAAPPAGGAPEEADGEPERPTATAAPAIPTRASVARAATMSRAINLRQVNLIGVFGTSSNRRALVRVSNGRITQVRVGDRLDGGRVAAIDLDRLIYVKNGRNLLLHMPDG